MDSADGSGFTARTGICPHLDVIDVQGFAELSTLFRSKSLVSPAEAFAGVHREPEPSGLVNVLEFSGNTLSFSSGQQHRVRRKALNKLVRPEALERIREDLVLPSLSRNMEQLCATDGPGPYGCDLVTLLSRVFVEFSAQLLGLQKLSNEALTRLQSLMAPMFAAFCTQFFAEEDREGVIQNALEAKREYVENFYRPAREACEELMAKVAAGELEEHDVPDTLMKFLVTAVEPSYADDDQAIRESLLLFVTSVNTSTQTLVNSVNHLTRWFDAHPEDRPLRTDPDFLSDALQESIRLWGPGVTFTTRVASEDFEFSGRSVKKDQELHLHLPRSDREAAIFGEDAWEFNPRRQLPPDVRRYGIAFGSGEHQCFGLRVVLGNDGKSGAHVAVLKGLFEAGVIPDLLTPPVMQQMETESDGLDVSSYASYPVFFTQWKPGSSGVPTQR